MAEMSGDNYGYFFDSENGDRKYNAASFEMWLKKFLQAEYSTAIYRFQRQARI